MAMFIIERNLAEQMELDSGEVSDIVDYNDNHELKWLFSFLSADRKKTYCLYEAPNPEALREQAKAFEVPADSIVEVSELNPNMFTTGASATGNLDRS
jgi:hypothetical protein